MGRVSDAEVIAALQGLADGLGLQDPARSRTPGVKDWDASPDRPLCSGAVCHRFGSWNKALLACGLEPRLPRWSRERIIDALRADARAKGRPPAANKWKKTAAGGVHPSASTVFRVFSTWSLALEAAGLPTRPAGWPARIARAGA